MVYLVDTNGCEANGSGDLVSEDLGTGGSGIRVYELAWDDTVAVKSLPVCQMCVRLTGVGRSIVPGIRSDLARTNRMYTNQPFCVNFFSANSSSLPGSGRCKFQFTPSL